MMEEKTKFSVLMAVYAKERPEFFDTAMHSIFDQTVPPAEVVLVEDGPLTPGLDEVVERYRSRYPKILKIVALPENRGTGFAANIGLKHCSHEIVARMDSDDISKPTRFEHQLKVLSENPEVAVVGSWVEEFSKDPGIVDGIRAVPEHDDEIRRYAKSRSPINQPSVVFRKSAVMAVGNYRSFYFYEDYDLWVRLILNGARFYNIPRCLVSQRNGAGLYARRGGWNYAVKEIKFLYGFHKMGLYGFPFFLRNVVIRTSVRLIPTGARAFFYKSFLRR